MHKVHPLTATADNRLKATVLESAWVLQGFRFCQVSGYTTRLHLFDFAHNFTSLTFLHFFPAFYEVNKTLDLGAPSTSGGLLHVKYIRLLIKRFQVSPSTFSSEEDTV